LFEDTGAARDKHAGSPFNAFRLDLWADIAIHFRRAWQFTAKWFCGSGFAATTAVTPCSGSVNTVIGDSDIAVSNAARPRGCSSGGAPIAGISGAPKADRIIVIGNRSTVAAAARRA
jgi:hypothetical protein